ncbi:MAG TPA: TAL effector repeat-containing protein, partial [Rhodanobacter sp.]|nr:TAL effector repeat-containing protein [Rhodanobacter sp.]
MGDDHYQMLNPKVEGPNLTLVLPLPDVASTIFNRVGDDTPGDEHHKHDAQKKPPGASAPPKLFEATAPGTVAPSAGATEPATSDLLNQAAAGSVGVPGPDRSEPLTPPDVAAAQAAIQSGNSLRPLLPGHDRHLILASSEGGANTTTDLDDPEGIRRVAQLILAQPQDVQDRTSFVAFVNTKRKAGTDELTTADGAAGLVDYLVEAGIDPAAIHRTIQSDPESGDVKSGIYVVYGDDPGAQPPVSNVPGAFDPGRDLSLNDRTEVTVLMLASPSGLTDVPAHNVGVVGDGKSSTNDLYGMPGESQKLLAIQAETVEAHLQNLGATPEQIEQEVNRRQLIFNFEAAHAASLTAENRAALFGPASALTSKIDQNKAHTIGVAAGASPDGAYGNRAFGGARQVLGVDEQAFKTGLAAERKGLTVPGIQAPNFVHSTQLPALVRYVQNMVDSGQTVDRAMMMSVLSRADGIVDGSTINQDALLEYYRKPDVMGANFSTKYGENFDAFVETIPADQRDLVLGGAFAIHLLAVEKQLNLLFPHLDTSERIPASGDQMRETFDDGNNGGWASSKVVEYDSLAAARLLMPSLDPAAVMSAVDMPDIPGTTAEATTSDQRETDGTRNQATDQPAPIAYHATSGSPGSRNPDGTAHKVAALGFSSADIVKIAGNIGGAQALQAVLDHHDALTRLGFPHADIVKIAGNNGGARALQAVLDHHDALTELGFTHADIVKIAGNIGGARALQAVLDLHEELSGLDFLPADIVKIAGNGGGAQALQAVLDHHGALTGLGFTHADIVKIAGNNGGAQALQAVLDHHDALTGLGFTPADVVKIADNGGGAQALQAVLDHLDELTGLGFTPADIVKIAGNDGGAQALQAVLDHHDELTG